MKLNYIFYNMEHQALVTLIVVCVTMIAPTFVQFLDILNKFVIENSMKSKLNIKKQTWGALLVFFGKPLMDVIL